MAFQAGCDLILTCRSMSVQEEAINGLKVGLDNGMIERYRVQESVNRILNMKNKVTSWEKAFAPPGIDNLHRLQPLHTKTFYHGIQQVYHGHSRSESDFYHSARSSNQRKSCFFSPHWSSHYLHLQCIDSYMSSRKSKNADYTLQFDNNASVMSAEKVFRELGRGLARQRNGEGGSCLIHCQWREAHA